MIKCIARLKSASPYGQSRAIQSTKYTGETSDAFENRTWRERMHVDENGYVFIPPMAVKNCLSEVAKYLSESVPGKGKATYTKHFVGGLMVMEPLNLGIKAETVQGIRLHVPADGVRGSGKRVWKTFPTIPSWEADVTIYIMDPVIKPDKVREYLEHAGKFIGLGFFRPRNNGYWGRFTVESFKTA